MISATAESENLLISGTKYYITTGDIPSFMPLIELEDYFMPNFLNERVEMYVLFGIRAK